MPRLLSQASNKANLSPRAQEPPVGRAAAKQSQFPHGPHWARAGNAAAAGDNRAKQSQFAGGTPGMGEGRQGRPSRRRWAKACETKPIPPERHEGQVLWGKRVMVNWSHKRLWRNKANFSIADRGQTSGGTPALRPAASDPRANRAKRTQFGGRNVRNEPNFPIADFGLRIGTDLRRDARPARTHCAKRTQFRRSARAPADEMCKTKPIWGPAGGRGAGVQNEPNFGDTTDRSRFEDLPLGRWAGRLSGEGKGYAEPHKTRWRKE
jgi:hypothetical protein